MQQVVIGFVELIRNAMLSGFFVYVILLGMLGLTTLGSLGNWRKIAAYVLGWLMAIFAVVLITSSAGGTIEAGTGSLLDNHTPVNFFALIVPALFGGGLGFGLMFLPLHFGDKDGVRALIIAVVMTTLPSNTSADGCAGALHTRVV